MDDRIYLSSPHMGGKELEYVREAFASNWISPVGPNITAFERELVTYSQVPYAAALSSGTAAIHLALIMLNIKRGDEVLCSSFTFAGSCNPVVYLGATPVFIDSEEVTWNMDPELLEKALRERKAKDKIPKALIIVHLYGMPAKMDPLLEIASRYGVPVIEDAAEAMGSVYHGKKAGGFGELGIFSFNGNKIITTSGGGALVSEQEAYIKEARFLSTQARDDAPHYEHSRIGYNYRMSNVVAGIGRGQLEVLDKHLALRRDNFSMYFNFFREMDHVQLTVEPENVISNRWLTTIFIGKNRQGITPESIRQGLEEANIEARPVWKPMHMQPVYSEAPAFLNGVSERLFRNGLCLPSGSNLSVSEKDRILGRLAELFEVTRIL